MKTDLELLTDAAKAIGLVGEAQDDYYLHLGDKNQICAFGCDDGECWSPLTDDGDAFRLAVTLRIDIQLFAACGTDKRPGDLFVRASVDRLGCTFAQQVVDDPCAATRRAIVRAAAQIGEAMP